MAQWTNLQRIEKFENLARLYINCEKSGGLYLAEPGLTAGWLAGWQAGWLAGRRNLGEAWDFKCLLQIEIFDFLLSLAEVLHYFNNFDVLQTLFSGKYCYKVVLWSVNFCEALWFHIDPYYTTLPCCMIRHFHFCRVFQLYFQWSSIILALFFKQRT